MRIALMGNPNSGKTTLFNAITGKIEHVGNWPGVTVEKKEGIVKSSLNPGKSKLTVVDLPGTYSLSPYTGEEVITKDFIRNESPQVIINLVDAGNLNRSLFLTTQLLELGIPLVVALNKSDIKGKKGITIDRDLLSSSLNCPVINTVATGGRENQLDELVRAAVQVYEDKRRPHPLLSDSDNSDDRKRYSQVSEILNLVERRDVDSSGKTKGDKLDSIVAHKILGLPIFAFVIWVVFSFSQSWIGPWLADTFVGWIDSFYSLAEGLIGGRTHPVLSSLLLDGMIGGVGALVGFLPLIMVLFFMLALLEDSGYMARVAVIMDRYFKKIGLSGKSIIPMIISTGCAIPGIMATRTIKNERQRRTTAMLAPFMPCGAKLPIIALFAGIFFNGNAWVGTSMYFLAIALVVLSGLIIRRITGDKSVSYFVMELPDYRMPSIKRAAVSMFNQAKAFLVKAGTIILVCNALVQLLQTFTWDFQIVSEATPEMSILASLASPMAWLFIPLGFGLWQFAAATVTGFIAKENVVGTLAVTFSITNFINVEELALVSGGSEVMGIFGIGAVAALSYLVFNLFTPPCFAAIGAMNAEMESRKWLWGAIGFQLGMGYISAFLVYQTGTLFTTGSLGNGFAGGLGAVLVLSGIIVWLARKGGRTVEPELRKAV